MTVVRGRAERIRGCPGHACGELRWCGHGCRHKLTATRARARHRGQCSIANQRDLGLMLRPHRGQIRKDVARGLAPGS